MMVQVLLLLALIAYAGWAEAYGTYIPRGERTPGQALHEMVRSPHRAEFERELIREHGVTFLELRQTLLITYPCGEGCDLETAGINEDGYSHYWRDVREEELVAGFIRNSMFHPLFLPECGNPVRRKVTPMLFFDVELELEADPEVVLYGCSYGTVQYSTGYWHNPGTWGYWGGAGHGYGWTVSHHRGMHCVWPSQDKW